MPTIRQEINLLNSTISSTTTVAATANEISQVDTTQYVNPTYYFEIVAKNTDTSDKNVDLVNGSISGEIISVLASTTNYTRFRSTAVTITSGQIPVVARINATTTSAGQVQVKAARLIIIDNPTTLTSTQTQIEIGMVKSGLTSTASWVVPDATLTKYWKYVAANWDGTKTFYAEVTYQMASSKSSGTFKLQEDNGSFASWADSVIIVNAGVASTPTRVRVAFTPTSGRNYRIVYGVASSKSAATIYNAKIIVDQEGVISESHTALDSATAFGDVASTEARGQSFTTVAAYTCDGIGVKLQKIGSPTDNLTLELLSGSITGTVIATSDTIAGTRLSTSSNWFTFNFATPVSLSNATKYYWRITRSGALDASNNYGIGYTASGNQYAGGGAYVRASGVWGAEDTSNADLNFKTFSSYPTLLEPQYLLLNTADAGGTINQDYDTLWDSTEWASVTNVYNHAMDSDNASNSADLVDIDNSDTQVTNSSVTGANQQISAALTMPTTGHQIDTDIDNTTGTIAASRILVATTVVVDSNVTVTPGKISLATTPFAPIIQHIINMASPTSLTLTTFAPAVVLGTTFTPSTATLMTSTFAPTVTVTLNQLVVPATATLTTSAFAPTVTASDHKNVTPATQSLTTASFAPTVTISNNQIAVPSTATLSLATFAPSIIFGTRVTPSTASLTLTTLDPTVTVSDHKTVTPTTAALTTSAFAPTVTASDNKSVTTLTASLTTSTFEPTVSVSSGVVVTPATASLTTAFFAPVIGLTVVPGTASFTTTAFAPSIAVSDNKTATPGVASLTLTTFTPDVAATANVGATPATASLTLSTFTPSVVASDHKTVVPAAASLTTTTFAPTVSVPESVVVVPGLANLTLTTFAPTVRRSIYPRSYYIDTSGNVYWVVDETIGLLERI